MLPYICLYLAVGLAVTIICVWISGNRVDTFTLEELIIALLCAIAWPVLLTALLGYQIWNVLKLPDVSKTVLWRRRP